MQKAQDLTLLAENEREISRQEFGPNPKEKVLHRIVREANELRARDPARAHLRAMIQERTCDWCGRDLHSVDDHKIVDR
jgi:hypothetical protein